MCTKFLFLNFELLALYDYKLIFFPLDKVNFSLYYQQALESTLLHQVLGILINLIK